MTALSDPFVSAGFESQRPGSGFETRRRPPEEGCRSPSARLQSQRAARAARPGFRSAAASCGLARGRRAARTPGEPRGPGSRDGLRACPAPRRPAPHCSLLPAVDGAVWVPAASDEPPSAPLETPERDMPPRMQFVATWQLRCSSPAEEAPGRPRSSQPGPGPQPGSQRRPLGAGERAGGGRGAPGPSLPPGSSPHSRAPTPPPPPAPARRAQPRAGRGPTAAQPRRARPGRAALPARPRLRACVGLRAAAGTARRGPGGAGPWPRRPRLRGGQLARARTRGLGARGTACVLRARRPGLGSR